MNFHFFHHTLREMYSLSTEDVFISANNPHTPTKKLIAASISFLSGCPFEMPPMSLNGPYVSKPRQPYSPRIFEFFRLAISAAASV